MIGAIVGDIIGSIYERNPLKIKDFSLFSETSTFADDTVMSVAVADCLLHKYDYTPTLQAYGRKYPNAGYGGAFKQWLQEEQPKPYNRLGQWLDDAGCAYRLGFQDFGGCFDRSAEKRRNYPQPPRRHQGSAVCS